MRVILFSGTALRHIYFANSVLGNCRDYQVVLHVRMRRADNLIEELKVPVAPEDVALLQKHNDDRNRKEQEYFAWRGTNFLPAAQVIETTPENLNGSEVVAAITAARADVALVYGTLLFRKPILDALTETLVINLHAGLSPWYRGSATLFWPLYFMEPQYAGCTFHTIDNKIDHGLIIHQNRPEIYSDDGVHDIGCRAIVQAAKDVGKLMEKIYLCQLKEPQAQRQAGKIFYTTDFKPHHLRVVNHLFVQGFLKEYLENRQRFPDPNLIAQF